MTELEKLVTREGTELTYAFFSIKHLNLHFLTGSDLSFTPQCWGKCPKLMWSLVFPGLHHLNASKDNDDVFLPSCQDSRWNFSKKLPSQFKAFLRFGQTDGEVLNVLVAKLKTKTGSSQKEKEEKDRFNSNSYRYRIQQSENKMIDLGELAGNLDTRKLNFGPGSHSAGCFRGLIPLEKALEEGTIRTGLEAAKSLFDNRLIFSIDSGVKNIIGGHVSKGSFVHQHSTDPQSQAVNFEYNWLKILKTSANYYYATNIDKHMNKCGDIYKDAEEDILDLSQHHARTLDVDEFKSHQEAFQRQSQKLFEKASEPGKLKMDRRLRSAKQRYLNDFISTVYALDEEFQKRCNLERTKAPVIIFGDSLTTNGMKNHRSVPSIALLNYLKRFFLVLTVDEYNTSQKCPKCWGQLKDAEGIRIKKCPNEECQSTASDGTVFPFHVNRDVSASTNLFAIALHLVSGLGRPKPFERPKKTNLETS